MVDVAVALLTIGFLVVIPAMLAYAIWDNTRG
jgi:hypothetical protein